MGFWVPKFFNSPILPPPFGAKRPGKENKKRFFRWDDFLRMSLPWCLMTCFEGPRGAKPLAGFSATIFLLIARFFSLVRSTFLSSSFFFDFDVEGFTIFVALLLKIYVGFVGECCEFFFFFLGYSCFKESRREAAVILRRYVEYEKGRKEEEFVPPLYP